jgi:CheY-like chemotaxis protein
VEAQGGRVGATSTLGQGSLFFAVLPRVAPRAAVAGAAHLRQPAAVAPGSTGAAADILVLDDDPAVLKLLEVMLRKHGLRPTCTTDPALALAAAQARLPDLLILDLLMPGVSGTAFLERFRAIPQSGPVPVIIWAVKDLSPPERAHLLTLAQAIVLKREGGIAALVDRVLAYVPQGAAGSNRSDGDSDSHRR